MTDVLPDFVDDGSAPAPVGSVAKQTTSDRLWGVVDATWQMYARCDGFCSRVEFVAAIIEFACQQMRSVLNDEPITREMLWARIAFEVDWLLAQPLMVFSRQRLESALVMWQQTYGM